MSDPTYHRPGNYTPEEINADYAPYGIKTPPVTEVLRDARRYLTQFGSVEPAALLQRIDAVLTNLEPLTSISTENRKAVVSWLEDCASDARMSDTSVGIYANEQMAEAFDALMAMFGEDRSA
jgi:hypothetical protein